ncbi:MAG: chromosome segregation ATPase [Pirellulaceae bacterium]|jgi:chromosome segregation ATPase
MSHSTDTLTGLDIPALAEIRETVSGFRSDCLGFEYQIQGLFNELETIYQAITSKTAEMATERAAWESRTQSMETQQDHLLQEVQQLRTIVDRQADLLAKLVE